MGRKLKFGVVVLMVALLPLRALATVTVGFCAMHGQASHSMDAAHDHGHDSAQHGESHHDQCNACVEHCGSASLVAPPRFPQLAAAGTDRITSGVRIAAGFVPDHLDPPPLAL